ncbi:MAG: DUF1080 domain-containing protein [Nitrospiraceae bacterium]|nr:DUF1080 domain-containing protein [Nitrospiraceae bacterium]
MRTRVAVVIALCLGGLATAEGPVGPDWVPALLTPEEAAEGFYPLFNGADLDGWHIRGANKHAFDALDGMLVVTGEGGGDWIFTSRDYENFVLRYEYRLPETGGNSGVAIRATRDGNPAFTGMEIQVLTPCEPPHAGSAGALYASVTPAVKADHPAGEWNAVEVLCDGPRIRTIMNGHELYDIDINTYDSPDKKNTPLPERAKSGAIALQDYGDPVEFRKIRIKPLPGGEGWRKLFNGKDLDGWTIIGDSKWLVDDDGILRVDNTGMTGRSALRTVETFTDFELRANIKPHDGANSGIFFRCSGDNPWPRTYEAQIDNHDSQQFTGAIWDQVPASELRAMDGCWFQMHVIAKGASIQVAVNGKSVVDYISSRHRKYPSGWICLQGHDPNSVVEFKDIEIKPID